MTSEKKKKQRNFFTQNSKFSFTCREQNFRVSLARRMVIYEHKTQQTTAKKVTQLE